MIPREVIANRVTYSRMRLEGVHPTIIDNMIERDAEMLGIPSPQYRRMLKSIRNPQKRTTKIIFRVIILDRVVFVVRKRMHKGYTRYEVMLVT